MTSSEGVNYAILIENRTDLMGFNSESESAPAVARRHQANLSVGFDVFFIMMAIIYYFWTCAGICGSVWVFCNQAPTRARACGSGK